jgi:hypothetical protein
MEAFREHLRETAPVPPLSTHQWRRQYRLREEPFLFYYGSLQSYCGLLHLPSSRNWQCRCHGDIFQEGQSEVYRYLDFDGYSWRSNGSLHLRVCLLPRRLSLDLLDSRNGMCLFIPLQLFERANLADIYD